jgi:hypothetical protein
LRQLRSSGETARVIGKLKKGTGKVQMKGLS